jgi:hypothetical protein
MYDLNDAQPQMLPTGEPIPDGTFARIRMASAAASRTVGAGCTR